MQKSSKGQGALEYLLLIGGAVLVAVVIIVLIINMVPTTGDEINETIDAGQSEIDQAYQDALANGGGGSTSTVTIINGVVSGGDYSGCAIPPTPLPSDWCDGKTTGYYTCPPGEYCKEDCSCAPEPLGVLGTPGDEDEA
ncbi:class III signal peptide-containing protein, partial [Candidatus Micrarchaeota archaeon]|nr:class III signal peptide-containing protein [Candidatus Micrarchaeota archaeon]